MTESLSSWWSARTHRALAHTSDPAVRLALALTPVRSVIRVIDDHWPPMQVEYAGVHDGKSVSYSDFTNNRIRISPLPIVEGKLPLAAALDVEIGFAMHEASHGKHSRDRYKDLIVKDDTGRDQPAFRPMRLAVYLWNVVEDVRIEQATSRAWPGFAPYFDAVLDYMWGHLDSAVSEGSQEEIDNPHPTLTAALKVLYLACRYPARAMERLEPTDAIELEWWKAWQHDYLTDATDTKETIQRGLDHLALDEQARQEMESLSAAEAAEQKAGEALRKQIERLVREGIDGAYGVCNTADGEIEELDAATAEKVDQLIREGLIEMDPIRPDNGVSNPPLHIRKPEESAASRRAYVGRPNAESEALRAALVFRPSAPRHDVKLLRQGVMDDEELYRWGLFDYRVFSERVIETKPDVFMGLLCDISGSMVGQSLETVQRLAQLFVWGLHDQEGVTTRVWAHTADVGENGVEIYQVWEQGDPMSRIGLIDALPHANNTDGHAISYCVSQMRDQGQPQKILFVLADGQPNSHGYGGAPAFAHVRSVVEWARREGVEVVQIAVDDDLRPEEQGAMFGASGYIPYAGTAELGRQLTRLMARWA